MEHLADLENWIPDVCEEQRQLSTGPLCSLIPTVEGIESQDNGQQPHLDCGNKQSTTEPQYSLSSTMKGIESEDLEKWLEEYDQQQKSPIELQCSVNLAVAQNESTDNEQMSQDSEQQRPSITEPQGSLYSTVEGMDSEDSEPPPGRVEEEQSSTTELQCSLNSSMEEIESVDLTQWLQDSDEQGYLSSEVRYSLTAATAEEMANASADINMDELFPNPGISGTLNLLSGSEPTDLFCRPMGLAPHSNDANLDLEPPGNSEMLISTSQNGGHVEQSKFIHEQEIPLIDLTVDSEETLELHTREDFNGASGAEATADTTVQDHAAASTSNANKENPILAQGKSILYSLLKLGKSENTSLVQDIPENHPTLEIASSTNEANMAYPIASKRRSTRIARRPKTGAESTTVVQSTGQTEQPQAEPKSSKYEYDHWKCKQCRLVFPDYCALDKHTSDSHFQLKCAHCDFRSYFVTSVKTHVTKTHQGRTLFRCFICMTDFVDDVAYERHMQGLHECL